MAKVYYDRRGGTHVLNTMYYGGQYCVYVNGHLYASADTRAEAEEVERDYVQEKGLSTVKGRARGRKQSVRR